MTSLQPASASQVDPAPTLIHCPSCQAAEVRFLGDSALEAGALTDDLASLHEQSGGLYLCRACDLIFRSPVPSPAALLKAYQSIPVDAWAYDQPQWWGWSAEAIRQFAPNTRVLDVGCFRGDFLASLDEKIEKFGIEPNQLAAEHAASLGVRIIGGDLMDDFSVYTHHFGAIVLMDVIEHVEDPAAVLSKFSSLLAPDGIFIVLTGDSTAWWVRRALPHYWYMAYPIHLVYLSDRYMKWLESKGGFVRLDWRLLSHKKAGYKERIKEFSKAYFFAFWHGWLKESRFERLVGSVWPFNNIRRYSEPPLLMTMLDHFWTVLKLKPR